MHLKSLSLDCWWSRRTSWSLKQMIDICLSDRRSLNWRMTRIVSWDSSTCISYDTFCSSQTCMESGVLSLKSVELHVVGNTTLSKLMKLFCNRSSIIDPIVRLLNLSSKKLIVLIDSIKSCFNLSDMLVFEIHISVPCAQRAWLDLWLDSTDSWQWTNI